MANWIASWFIVLLPVCAFAQSRDGMHVIETQEGLEWIKPTPQSALDAILAEIRDIDPARAILRQKFDPLTAAELDAFAEELIKIVREGDWIESTRAAQALLGAARETGEGIPYSKVKGLFIRTYASLKDTDHIRAGRALNYVLRSGGEEYVRTLFHTSDKPENACVSGNILSDVPDELWCPYKSDPWCAAGRVLVSNAESERKSVKPLASDPTADEVMKHCDGYNGYKNGYKELIIW